MKKTSMVGIVFLGLALSACESMSPANYSTYADNVVAMRKLPDAKVSVASMVDESKFDSGCRLVGPITASGNRSVPEFIKDSFNEEFKFSNAYSTEQDAAKLDMTIVSAEFSSSSGLTHGWWKLAVKLDNPVNGQSLTKDVRYDFQSGFSAIAACQNTSEALTPAVQRLINAVITDSGFAQLVGHKG